METQTEPPPMRGEMGTQIRDTQSLRDIAQLELKNIASEFNRKIFEKELNREYKPKRRQFGIQTEEFPPEIS